MWVSCEFIAGSLFDRAGFDPDEMCTTAVSPAALWVTSPYRPRCTGLASQLTPGCAQFSFSLKCSCSQHLRASYPQVVHLSTAPTRAMKDLYT